MMRFQPAHIILSVLLAACLYVLHRWGYAPADLPKEAASFNLPIALGMLAGSGQLACDRFDRYAAVGELALDGATRPTKGALSMAITAAKDAGLTGLLVPSQSAAEAAVVEGIEVIAVASLAQAAAFFAGEIEIEPTPSRLEELRLLTFRLVMQFLRDRRRAGSPWIVVLGKLESLWRVALLT